MKNKNSSKLLIIAVGVILIVIVILLIIKKTYKSEEVYVNVNGDSNYLNTKVIDFKINISTSNYSYKLKGYKGKIENIVSVAGCAFDDNYNLITVLTSDGLYALYVGNSYIYQNLDDTFKLVKISDRDNIKSLNYEVVGNENEMKYDFLACFKYPSIEYKDGSVKVLDPGTTDVNKVLNNKDDYTLVNIK